MSGRKESDIALQKEKEEKLQLISRISEMREKLAGLSNILSSTLQSAPQGVKNTFEKEVKAAELWVQRLKGAAKDKVTLDLAREALNRVLQPLEDQYKEGLTIFTVLTDSLTQKSEALEKSLYSKLAQSQCNYAGCQESIKTWFGIDDSHNIETLLSSAGSMLRQKQLGQADKKMAEIDSILKSKIQEAEELEYKHQKRKYVLKALRQVCTEMGFEDSEPRFEKPGNRNRVVYEVDTFSQGKICFYLTLDGISSESGIVESKCLDEFDKLSASLEEEFGVKTRFKTEGEGPKERLIHKGEIDLPYGTSMERNAQV
jgi:hypothetical protein